MEYVNRIKGGLLQKYRDLCAAGKFQEAAISFINDYILPAGIEFQRTLQAIMRPASNILSSKAVDDIGITITSKTNMFTTTMSKLYSQFVTDVYADGIFNYYSITNPVVKKTITGNALETFQKLTDGALWGVSNDAKIAVREHQQQMLIIEEKVKNLLDTGLIDQAKVFEEKAKMYEQIRETKPEFYQMTEDGQFIQYRDGSMHTIDSYTDMATRTTLLNTERTAVEINESIEGNQVVEYYLADDREIKGDEREVCIEVMDQLTFGASLIALTEEAAGLLEIPYIEDIRADGAMGPNCRHGIRNPGEEVLAKVNKALWALTAEGI